MAKPIKYSTLKGMCRDFATLQIKPSRCTTVCKHPHHRHEWGPKMTQTKKKKNTVLKLNTHILINTYTYIQTNIHSFIHTCIHSSFFFLKKNSFSISYTTNTDLVKFWLGIFFFFLILFDLFYNFVLCIFLYI